MGRGGPVILQLGATILGISAILEKRPPKYPGPCFTVPAGILPGGASSTQPKLTRACYWRLWSRFRQRLLPA